MVTRGQSSKVVTARQRVGAHRCGGEQRSAPEPLRAEPAWCGRLRAAIEAVDATVASSVLPAEAPPAAVAAVDSWLRDVRKRFWE